MSENLNPKELPHELLMRKYSLSMSSLSKHTQQLKKDLDRTLHLVINKSKNGVVNLTPNTQSKIEAYDRYICDGIFEFLDDQEVITEQQGDTLEKQMDEKRDDVVEKMEKINEEQSTQPTQPQEKQDQKPNDDNKSEGGDVKVGSFWDWS
jgi:hypothetical protein